MKKPPHMAGCKCRYCRARVLPHTCHARRCKRECPPAQLMCKRHWRMVPRPLQQAVWKHYRPGQEVGKHRPTAEYLDAANAAIEAVANAEHETRVSFQQRGLFSILIAVALAGCATMQVRRAYRDRCAELRGPVMTWYGGPTVLNAAWDECISSCELGAPDG